MKRYANHLVTLLGLTLLLAIVIPQRALADDDDPPTRVARLAYIQGNVSFQPAGTDDWVAAVVNRPLTTGDKLWNDNDSLSELHLGAAYIRLGSNTGFSFLNLTDNMTQIRLTEGTLNIRVRRLSDDEAYEVDTPNLAFSLLRSGNYKINVNESGDATVVLIRDGEGEITGGGSAYTLHPHDVGTFYGTDQINADVESWDNTADDFDDWCSDRDRRIDHSVSSRYVSDEVIGYEDLDEHGGWRSTPDYGQVWFPHTTIVGWAPYHYGHWVYIAPWGYTWVDDAPWGFAPFHYGRWVVVGGVWGWVPAPPRPVVVGVAYVRPVYAPALVAWVGGPHFAVGIGVGGGAGVSVGWFPLGPREVYVPSYPVSRTYVQNINVTNTVVNTTVVNNYYNTTVVNHTTVNNVTYVNQRVPGAVTATTTTAFTSAQPVARNVVAVNAREVAAAPVAVGAPAVAPAKQAVLGTGAVARVQPPAALQARAVVAKTTPPPPPPSFAKQQQAIQANGGRPLAVTQIRQIQPEPVAAQAHAAVKIAPAAKPQEVQVRGPQPNPNRTASPNNAGIKPATPPSNATNRPATPPTQPAAPPATATNRPGNPAVNAKPNTNANTNANTNVPVTQKSYSDRPPSARPNTATPANPNPVNLQLDQKHTQDLQNLRSQQDLERQKVEQQQQQEKQKLEQQQQQERDAAAKKAADEQAQQKLNQQRQEQTQQLERQKAEQQQQQERAAEAQKAAQEQAQQRLNQQHQQQLQQLEQKHNAEEQKLQQQQQQERKSSGGQPAAKPAPKNEKPKNDKNEKPH